MTAAIKPNEQIAMTAVIVAVRSIGNSSPIGGVPF
jgi:hypothetical protein